MKIARACLCLATLFVLAGCGGAKDEYYRLSAAGPAVIRSGGIAVGVGPLALPTYVDRAELVFQSGPNKFEIPAKVRWAGALQDNFGQVLAADIGRHLQSSNIVANPAPGDTRFRYRVSVSVRQFHAISGQEAILEADWRVETADTRQVLRHGDGPCTHQRGWLRTRRGSRERPRRATRTGDQPDALRAAF